MGIFERFRKPEPSATGIFSNMPKFTEDKNLLPLMDFRAKILTMGSQLKGVVAVDLGEQDMFMFNKVEEKAPDVRESFLAYYKDVENDKSRFAQSRRNFSVYLLNRIKSLQ